MYAENHKICGIKIMTLCTVAAPPSGTEPKLNTGAQQNTCLCAKPPKDFKLHGFVAFSLT